jgi:transposase
LKCSGACGYCNIINDEDDQTRWRRKGNTPPGERILTSPHDTDARLSKKRGSEWVGYKAHLTETCDDDTPNLVTHVETTLATTADSVVVDPIHADLNANSVCPVSIWWTTAMVQVRLS